MDIRGRHEVDKRETQGRRKGDRRETRGRHKGDRRETLREIRRMVSAAAAQTSQTTQNHF